MTGKQDQVDVVPNFAAAWAAQARYYRFNDLSLGKHGRTSREIVYPSVAFVGFLGCLFVTHLLGVGNLIPLVGWVVALVAFPLIGWGASMLPRIEGLYVHQLLGPFFRHLLTRRTVLLGWMTVPSTHRRVRFESIIELCDGSKHRFGRIRYTGPGTVTRRYPCARGEVVYSGVDRFKRRKPVLRYRQITSAALSTPKVMVIPAGVTVEFLDNDRGRDRDAIS